MDKLSNPFKTGAIRITQTTHNNLGGHSDFSLVRAIDCNREPFDNKVYAEGDGVVIASVNRSNPNSYLHIHYDGLPGHILRELVHVRPASGIVKGTKLKRGQLVGTLEPYRANWYGTGLHHAVHLHWSFLNTNKTGAPNPFNYLDRRTQVTTNAAVIRNHRTWFNADGSFNWSSFGDYKLQVSTPAPTPPSCEAEKRQIKALEDELKGVKDQLVKSMDEKKDLEIEVSKLKGIKKEMSDLIIEKNSKIENLQEMLRDCVDLERKYNDLLTKVKNLKRELAKKDKKILELQEKLDKGTLESLTLGDFIRWIGLKLRVGVK